MHLLKPLFVLGTTTALMVFAALAQGQVGEATTLISLPHVIQKTPMDAASVLLQTAVIEEIRSLIQRWQGNALMDEGWLHVVEAHDREEARTGVLPNGQPIPADYISENWYHLGDEGQLIELVAFMKDVEGTVVQVSSYREGIWRNLTFDESWLAEAAPVSLDFGFIREIENNALFDSSVNRQEIVGDGGKPVVLFSIVDSSGGRRIAFDLESGAVLSVRRWLVDELGQQQVVEEIRFLTIEKLGLPSAEVFEHLISE